MASPALGQSSDYTVTATLNPAHESPGWGPIALLPTDGLVRGVDGWLYAVTTTRSSNYGFFLGVLRISPTRGTSEVLFVVETVVQTPLRLLPGRDGRLYFPVIDSVYVDYVAPGYDADFLDLGGCSYGCVLFIDTQSHGQIRQLWYVPSYGDIGNYPAGDLIVEDADGAIYLETREGVETCLGSSGALIKVAYNGDATVLQRFGCDPPFDWSTVVPSGNDVWRWSDGLEYFVDGQEVYQRDLTTLTTTLIASISLSDGGPIELAEASGYVYGITNGGGALGGGIVFRVRVPSLASPDLVVTELSDPPPALIPGDSFTIADTTQNTGPEPAATSATQFFLSLTGEQLDVSLGKRQLPELGTAVESSGTSTVTIRGTAALGTYRLVACADYGDMVAEADDANNCVMSAATIVLTRPDLLSGGVSDPPVVAGPNQTFVATDIVLNQGIVRVAESTTTRYYFSFDTAIGAGDLRLKGARSVPALDPAAQASGSVTLSIPSTTGLGTYFLLACADDTNRVKEVDETNNCHASSNTVTITLPDLRVVSVSNPPAETSPGGSVSVSDVVENQGQADAGSFSIRYYFSFDAVKSTGDYLLIGSRSVTALTSGMTSSGTKKVSVGTSVPIGVYYLLACADDLLRVNETNETNNCRASSATLRIGWPDLVTSSISSPPASAVRGGQFSVTDTARNQGDVTAGASATRYYFSADAAKDAGDPGVAARSVPILGPGAVSTGSRTVSVPSGIASGTYYVLACADDLAKVAESNNGNNCAASATTVTIP